MVSFDEPSEDSQPQPALLPPIQTVKTVQYNELGTAFALALTPGNWSWSRRSASAPCTPLSPTASSSTDVTSYTTAELSSASVTKGPRSKTSRHSQQTFNTSATTSVHQLSQAECFTHPLSHAPRTTVSTSAVPSELRTSSSDWSRRPHATFSRSKRIQTRSATEEST